MRVSVDKEQYTHNGDRRAAIAATITDTSRFDSGSRVTLRARFRLFDLAFITYGPVPVSLTDHTYTFYPRSYHFRRMRQSNDIRLHAQS